QAFEMCCVCEWNLSYECLTSFSARKQLWEMKDTDPEFWKELTEAKTLDLPTQDITMPEDWAGVMIHPWMIVSFLSVLLLRK
ncbi:hypothetical protein L208DRAFT_1235875, partial [Tricholoma matsutake]